MIALQAVKLRKLWPIYFWIARKLRPRTYLSLDDRQPEDGLCTTFIVRLKQKKKGMVFAQRPDKAMFHQIDHQVMERDALLMVKPQQRL
jgi:hypothetical protein